MVRWPKGTSSFFSCCEHFHPVIPSVTWAFGPPMDMKVAPACHSERSPAPYGAGEARNLLLIFFSQQQIPRRYGMTEWLDDFRRSGATNRLLLLIAALDRVETRRANHINLPVASQLFREQT